MGRKDVDLQTEDVSPLTPVSASATATRVAGWTNIVVPTVVWLVVTLSYFDAKRSDRASFKVENEAIFITAVILLPGIVYLWSSARIKRSDAFAMRVARVIGLVQVLGYGSDVVLTLLNGPDKRNGAELLLFIVVVFAILSLMVVTTCSSALRVSVPSVTK